MILAAVGKNATGKDYFLEYLAKKYDLPMFSVGDIVREFAAKDGLEATRENLHATSSKYMTAYGQDFFPKQLIEKIKTSGMKNVLISGIRPLSDVMSFKDAFGDEFILIDVVISDDKERFRRMQVRASARDPQTFEKFLEYDKGEEELFHTSKTEAMADYIIKNDGTQADFHDAADKFYDEHIKPAM